MLHKMTGHQALQSTGSRSFQLQPDKEEGTQNSSVRYSAEPIANYIPSSRKPLQTERNRPTQLWQPEPVTRSRRMSYKSRTSLVRLGWSSVPVLIIYL